MCPAATGLSPGGAARRRFADQDRGRLGSRLAACSPPCASGLLGCSSARGGTFRRLSGSGGMQGGHSAPLPELKDRDTPAGPGRGRAAAGRLSGQMVRSCYYQWVFLAAPHNSEPHLQDPGLRLWQGPAAREPQGGGAAGSRRALPRPQLTRVLGLRHARARLGPPQAAPLPVPSGPRPARLPPLRHAQRQLLPVRQGQGGEPPRPSASGPSPRPSPGCSPPKPGTCPVRRPPPPAPSQRAPQDHNRGILLRLIRQEARREAEGRLPRRAEGLLRSHRRARL